MQVPRLHTFGSVFVAGENGAPLGGAAAQRRTLALLSVLAVAGEAGISRDKLVGILWSESHPERARHSLTQGLYGARRALREDDLFVADADVRLKGDRLTSDVREFETALDEGHLERAAALYQGPFLDGFFLSGAPEFERWASIQRERLEARARVALEGLAVATEERGDLLTAVEWRRRLVAIAPLDGAATARLMSALADAGDRAGALRQAQIHEILIREQLDVGPDPVVSVLAARLRDTPEQSRALAVAAASPPVAAPTELSPVPDLDLAPPAATVEDRHPIELAVTPAALAPQRAPRARSRRWWLAPALGTVGLALVGAGVLIGRTRSNDPRIPGLRSPQRVVVAPFRVASAESSLGYLRDGMVELLATRLADDSAARSVDAGAVLEAWRVAGVAANVDVPRETVVRLAHRLGAERVVVGSVIGTPARMIVRASVITTPTGVVSADATVTGPSDSLTTLVDRLAAHLLAAEAKEDERLTSLTSASLPALRAYLAGQAAVRDAAFPRAIAFYEEALSRDPDFGLAGLRLAMAAERVFDADRMRRGLAAAWRTRDVLSARDLASLVAYVGGAYPAPPSLATQVGAWQHLVDLAPRRAGVWFEQGARLFHEGAAAGMPLALGRAAESFERALTIQPEHESSRDYLALLGRNVTDEETGFLANARRWRRSAAASDARVGSTLGTHARDWSEEDLTTVAMLAQFDAVRIEDAARALEFLAERSARPSEQAELAVALHAVAMNRGRLTEAARQSARLRRLQPASHAGLRLRILDGIFGESDLAASAAAASQLAAVTSINPSWHSTTSSTWAADVCTLGQWRLSRGDTTGVGAAATALRRRGDLLPSPLVGTAPLACAELLDAWRAVVARQKDAGTRLQRLDSLVLTPQVAGDAVAYAPLLIERLHLRLADTTGALAALRRRVYMAGWPRYQATMWREEAELASRAGDVRGAIEALRAYLALRDAPESSAVSGIAAARRELARLEAAPAGR